MKKVNVEYVVGGRRRRRSREENIVSINADGYLYPSPSAVEFIFFGKISFDTLRVVSHFQPSLMIGSAASAATPFLNPFLLSTTFIFHIEYDSRHISSDASKLSGCET